MAKQKSNAPHGADLAQDERLSMAASYLEQAMERILVCSAALNSKSSINAHEVATSVARILHEDVHNDIDVAREIFQTWKAAEVGSNKDRSVSKVGGRVPPQMRTRRQFGIKAFQGDGS